MSTCLTLISNLSCQLYEAVSTSLIVGYDYVIEV